MLKAKEKAKKRNLHPRVSPFLSRFPVCLFVFFPLILGLVSSAKRTRRQTAPRKQPAKRGFSFLPFFLYLLLKICFVLTPETSKQTKKKAAYESDEEWN